MARAAAIGLEDATPERFEATMKVVLLSYYGGDAARNRCRGGSMSSEA